MGPMDVTIVEVSPRDGLQNEAVVLSTEAKVELIGRLVEAGARRVEAVSFAHPRVVPAMADAEAVMERVPRTDGVAYAGLVLNRRGLDRARPSTSAAAPMLSSVEAFWLRRLKVSLTQTTMLTSSTPAARARSRPRRLSTRPA